MLESLIIKNILSKKTNIYVLLYVCNKKIGRSVYYNRLNVSSNIVSTPLDTNIKHSQSFQGASSIPQQGEDKFVKKSMSTGAKIGLAAGGSIVLLVLGDLIFAKGKHLHSILKGTPKKQPKGDDTASLADEVQSSLAKLKDELQEKFVQKEKLRMLFIDQNNIATDIIKVFHHGLGRGKNIDTYSDLDIRNAIDKFFYPVQNSIIQFDCAKMKKVDTAAPFAFVKDEAEALVQRRYLEKEIADATDKLQNMSAPRFLKAFDAVVKSDDWKTVCDWAKSSYNAKNELPKNVRESFTRVMTNLQEKLKNNDFLVEWYDDAAQKYADDIEEYFIETPENITSPLIYDTKINYVFKKGIFNTKDKIV